MKITALELANVKRIKALRLVPTDKGLTIIGGKNCAGKTSVLDAIAFGFGGKKYMPSNLKREGSIGETMIHIETDNGLVIERKGKNADLHVTDKDGKRGGQAILDALLSELAIDLPKFHNARPTDKTKMLFESIEIDDSELVKLGFDTGTTLESALAFYEREEKAKFDTRTVIGRQADQKEKAAKDMPYHEDVPESPISPAELIRKNEEILSRNGVKKAAQMQLEKNREILSAQKSQIESLKNQIAELEEHCEVLSKSIKDAESSDFTMESTDEIQRQIEEFEEINRKVNENAERARRESEADVLRDQYDELTAEIERIRASRITLLNNAKFPLDGLSVVNGEVVYNGEAWDCMSGAQQLIVDCAIASSINPECRFVLMDKLEQLDMDTLKDFGEWLEKHDLQCIATRVSSGDECSIIIEDGESFTPVGQVIVPVKESDDLEY